jgi:hypothetical protein
MNTSGGPLDRSLNSSTESRQSRKTRRNVVYEQIVEANRLKGVEDFRM